MVIVSCSRRLLLLFVALVVWAAAWTVSQAMPEAPALARGPYLQLADGTSVVVRWRTQAVGQGRVEYRPPGDGVPRRAYSGFGPNHRTRLVGLKPGRRYEYRLYAGDTPVGGVYAFTAGKLPTEPIQFLVFGDSGDGKKGQYRLAAKMAEQAADFAIHTGDVIYPSGADRHYDRGFFIPYASLLARMVIWPALGNHDIVTGDGAPYFHNFDLPANGPSGLEQGRNYSFDYGSARFVCIDSNMGQSVLEHRIAPWLEQTLSAGASSGAGNAGVTWRFAFFHHPPYSDGAHGDIASVRRALVPALERARADVVFCGHDHLYQRTHPLRGVTYIVSGGGGAKLYPRRRKREQTASFYNDDHSFVLVSIDGTTLSLRCLNTAGVTVDSHTIRKP
jgi:acid phosphatase type 7